MVDVFVSLHPLHEKSVLEPLDMASRAAPVFLGFCFLVQ